MASSRKEKAALTRQALKRAALETFSKNGYVETSISAITNAAGVAHGTFYLHFQNKEAVLDELLAEFNAGYTQRVIPIVAEAGGTPNLDLVARAAGVFLDYWQENRAFIESYVQRAAGGLSLIALRDGLSPQLVPILSRWMGSTTGHSGANAAFVAQLLLAMWSRAGLQYLFAESATREEAIELLARMTWGAAAAVVPGIQDITQRD